MTAEDLIEELKKLDPKEEIYTNDPEQGGAPIGVLYQGVVKTWAIVEGPLLPNGKRTVKPTQRVVWCVG